MVLAFSDADLVKYVNTILKKRLAQQKIESQKQTFQRSKTCPLKVQPQCLTKNVKLLMDWSDLRQYYIRYSVLKH